MKPTTKVSVIVPCRNEAGYIATLLENLLRQKTDRFAVEFLVADGMSDDGTRAIVQEFCLRHPEVRLVDNPDRIVSTGLNSAIREAAGEVIIRMDAHTDYADDYVTSCVEVLEQTGADNVGGPWRARGKSYLQKAIALAFQSPFSSGGARSHAVSYEGAVDSVYLGCWRKSTLLKLGLFDEALVRNQDDELNLRLVLMGGKVWQSSRMQSWYYPRRSVWALFRQYLQYGYWKVAVIRKHKRPAALRHLVPSAFVVGMLSLLLASTVSAAARWAFLALAGLYLVFNLVASVSTVRRAVDIVYLPVLPFIFLAFHWGYGLGFVLGLVDFARGTRASHRAVTHLTR